MITNQDFWTVNELAEAARVSSAFVRKAIRLRRLASIRFGAAHRIPPDAAEGFLQQGTAARQLRHDVADTFREAARVR